jgi:hypothetical protein
MFSPILNSDIMEMMGRAVGLPEAIVALPGVEGSGELSSLHEKMVKDSIELQNLDERRDC